MMSCHHCADPAPAPLAISIGGFAYCSEDCLYCCGAICGHVKRKIARLERDNARLRELLRASLSLVVDIHSMGPRIRAQCDALLDELGRRDSAHERVTTPSLHPPGDDADDEPTRGDEFEVDVSVESARQ